jgi:hypothetical protein
MANYIGPTWNLDGAVQNVVKANGPSSDATITGQNSWANIGLSHSITPLSSSSKVLVTITVPFRLLHTTANQIMRGGWRVLRNGSTCWNTSHYDELIQVRESGSEWNDQWTVSFVDEPITSSSVTYTVQGLLKSGTGLRIYNYGRGCHIVLQEIGG